MPPALSSGETRGGRSPPVRGRGIGFALLAALFLPTLAAAQHQPPSQTLLVTAVRAATWLNDRSNIIQLAGPVKIELDRTTLTARDAVIWLEPTPKRILDEQTATI